MTGLLFTNYCVGDGVVGVVKFNDVPVIFLLTVKFVSFITPDTVTPVIFPPVVPSQILSVN